MTPSPAIKWPSASEYSDAIQNPKNCFADPELQTGKAATNALGSPVGASGNFAVVYPFQAGSTKYAVRCFIRAVVDQQQRYDALSRHLEGFSLEALVKFQYLERGIRVGGHFRPIVKMEWASGIPLGLYFEQHAQDSVALSNLAKKWRGIIAGLTGARIAHNDLQHGNILVGDNQQIRLVDYDGFYLKALAGNPPGERGHPAYQHPERLRTGYFEENADAFPALVIYTSLLALASDPKLKPFHTGENLIFRQEDFERPGETEVWQALKRNSNPQVARLARKLEESCRQPLSKMQDLETIIQDIPAPVQRPAHRPQRRQPVSRRRRLVNRLVDSLLALIDSAWSHPRRNPVAIGISVSVVVLGGVVLSVQKTSHDVPPIRPAIVSFEATPNAVAPGQSAVLHWSVRGARRVVINPAPGVVQPDGSASVAPRETATYELIAEGPGGKTQASLPIEVLHPAPLVNALPVVPATPPKQPEAASDDHAEIAEIRRVAAEGKVVAALAAAEKLLRLHRDDREIRALRGELLASRDRQLAVHLAKAKTLWSEGHSNEALAECDSALSLDQTNIDASSLREKFTKALDILNGTKK